MRRIAGLLIFFIAGAIVLTSPVPRGTGAEATTLILGAGGVMLETAIHRPDGDRRFPVAVVSHGNPRDQSEARRMTPDFRHLATWLVDHGFAVIIPMRRGFGKSGGTLGEGYGTCDNADYVRAGRTTADDIDDAVRYTRDQVFVDPTRIVLIGQSGGGFGSLAEASRSPQGVIAVVNFAGGRGSPRFDFVCSADRLVEAMSVFGKTTTVPTLWIYAANDHFFGPVLARRMFEAFATGSPSAEFVAAPPSGSDGHQLVHTTGWEPVVDAFLKKVVPGP